MIIKFGAQRPVYVIDIGHAIIRTLQKRLGSQKTVKKGVLFFSYKVVP